jgi:putative peptidoglycan lipid II flippase
MPLPATSRPTLTQRVLRNLRPSHKHSAYSATLLLIGAQVLSRIIGYVREMYVAAAFGAGRETDVYNAAFQIPDFLYYIVAGGAASITFVSIYTRYLAEERHQEAERVFSIVLTVMISALVVGILAAEIMAPTLVRLVFPGFTAHPDEVALCVHLTRILLPMQLFFYVGGVLSAVLLSRRMFLIPALAPVFYTGFIILGGVTLSSRMGIASLAVGAVAGAALGPFLINAIGAARTGIRFRPSFDIANSGFREWVRLSIPLMLGISLATADRWIMNWFASHGLGDISRLSYAKRLFDVPYGVLGLAIGVASMTFFSKLFSENRLSEFASTISDSVYRSMAASFLLSAWLVAAALPAVDLVYRRGRFHFGDSQQTAIYFALFAPSLAFWTAQALYARAFYATRNTAAPMIAATVVTVVSLPVFWILFQTFSVPGLAIASDVGIIAQTATLAFLLHRRKLVPLGGMRWMELSKAFASAAFAAALGVAVGRLAPITGSRADDLSSIALVTLTWAAAVALGLWITRSELPQALRRKPAPAIATNVATNNAEARDLPRP